MSYAENLLSVLIFDESNKRPRTRSDLYPVFNTKNTTSFRFENGQYKMMYSEGKKSTLHAEGSHIYEIRLWKYTNLFSCPIKQPMR